MLEEQGRVVQVDTDAVWVETIQKSTCQQCAARKGCGQHLLSEISSSDSTIQLRVLKKSNDDKNYHVGEFITIGIPENSIVTASLLVYFIPLFFVIVFLTIAHIVNSNELSSVIFGAVGLFVGIGTVHLGSRYYKNDSRLQPVIISDNKTSSRVFYSH